MIFRGQAILIFLFIVFVIAALLIWWFAPDRIWEPETFTGDTSQIWFAIRKCRTAAYKKPRLLLQPINGSVRMQLDFIGDEVHLRLPLKYLKDGKAEAFYLELFEDADLKPNELMRNQHIHEITGILDRRDEVIEAQITKLYRRVFDTNYKDKVKIITHTLASDTSTLTVFYNNLAKVVSREKITSASVQHEGRTARAIQIGRLMRSANIFLFPIMVIQSYNFFGVAGLCWAVSLFSGFFWSYYVLYRRRPLRDNWGAPLYVGMAAATWLTKDTNYLLFIPSISGLIMAILSAGLALNILQPTSKSKIGLKGKAARQYKLTTVIGAVGGIALFLMGEWARRNLHFEDWVTFFAFVRFEIMLVILPIFIPALLVFFKIESQREAREGGIEGQEQD